MAVPSRLVEGLTKISSFLAPRHFIATGSALQFTQQATEALLSSPGSNVADIAAGKSWHLNPNLKKYLRLNLVGIDIDGEEMRHNEVIDRAIEADVCKEIPTPDGPYSVITCRAGVEHFPDTEAFLRNAHQALQDNGKLILWFPNKFAPYALVNQILPRKLALASLKSLTKAGERGETGFRAHYDKTSYRSFTKAYARVGFQREYFYPSFQASWYFAAVPPVYLLSVLLDYLRFMIGRPSIASHYCFVLRRTSNA